MLLGSRVLRAVNSVASTAMLLRSHKARLGTYVYCCASRAYSMTTGLGLLPRIVAATRDCKCGIWRFKKKQGTFFFLFASSSLGWLACQRPCVGVASRRPILRRPLRFALPARASLFQSERAYGLPRLPTDVWLVAAAGGNTGMHCQATPSCFYVILGGNHAAGGGRLMRCQWMATIEHGRARLSALSPLWVRSYVRTYELRSCPCPPPV